MGKLNTESTARKKWLIKSRMTNKPVNTRRKNKFEFILLALHLSINDLPLESEQLEHIWPVMKSLKEAHDEVSRAHTRQALTELLEKKQICYDCQHDETGDLENVTPYIPVSVIEQAIRGVSNDTT